jgi:two-component sensor histidine kinase
MYKYIFFLFLYTSSLFSFSIDESSSNVELLNHSYIFVDTTDSLTKEEVLKQKFSTVKKRSLNFGIIPESRVWVKLTLTNTTNKELKKILEYANIKPEEVILYDGEEVYEDGLFLHHRSSLRPTFKITLPPHETKTYLIAAHSSITALITRLTLWSVDEFYMYELEEKLFIMAFFTIFFTLLLYNFIIYIFTKEQVYFYYTLYLGAVILFEIVYLGIGQIYLFSHAVSIIVTKGTLLSVTLLVVPMILFSMKLLQSERFEKIHLGLKLYLYLFPLVALLGYDNFLFNVDALGLLLPLVFLFLAAGYLAYKEGTKEALLYLVGWGFVLLTLVFAVLQSLGVFNIFSYIRRTTEIAFAAEVFIFSIAIAYRLKRLSQEKVQLSSRLIELQKDEQKRLERVVEERTNELELSLGEKETLFKELQHRVKNNLSFIVSILELQIAQSDSKKLKDELLSTSNRIHSFASMYELLLYDKSSRLLTVEHYFQKIVDYIQDQFFTQVNIEMELLCEIPSQKLIHFGLILNELVTNSYKHAFDENTGGLITIKLFESGNTLCFVIKDNGRGYGEKKRVSLGSTIIETLVKKQLGGEMQVESSEEGLEVFIRMPKGDRVEKP